MIPEHPTWHINDASKLSIMSTCWRKDFYESILGWRAEGVSHDAFFGESWHKAREYMLLNGYEDVYGAYDAFLSHYRSEFEPETDELYRPKDPMGALNAILKFAENYPRDLLDNELLYTEISGSVPVDHRRSLYFRMDSILRSRDTGKVFSWDHKSTKKFSRQWENDFALSWQSGTYTHCLYSMFPIDEVIGIEFCGTGFEFLSRNSKLREAGYHASFKRVPAWKRKDQMQVWLWQVIDILNRREMELDRLSQCSENDKVMMAFPMRPTSCSKYWGCIFHDFCCSWENPLQHCFEPPIGFVQSFWDPTEIKTTNKVALEWEGEL